MQEARVGIAFVRNWLDGRDWIGDDPRACATRG